MSLGYSPEERARIVAHVLAEVSGGRAVSRVLKDDEGMPACSVFWQWHMADDELREQLAHARLNGVEALMDEARDIADTPCIGETVTVSEENGETVKREDMLGHRKLQVETRFKYAQMIAPRKYGPKMDLTSDGGPLQVVINKPGG